MLNAFQDGQIVHFDTPEAKNNMFPFFPDVHGAPFNGAEAMSTSAAGPWTWVRRVDGFTSIERMTDTAAEFPRIDDRFAGMPYRHGWIWRWICVARWNWSVAVRAACS